MNTTNNNSSSSSSSGTNSTKSNQTNDIKLLTSKIKEVEEMLMLKKNTVKEKSAPKNCLTKPVFDALTSMICGQEW